MELFYCANVPLRTADVENKRATRCFANALARRGRIHCIYGESERNQNLSPIVLEPLQHMYFEMFHPSAGQVTVPHDKRKIEELVQQLIPYIPALKPEYKGDVDEEGLPHGHGKQMNADGSSYEGEWRHGKHHGAGVAIYADGDIYTGEHCDNRRTGEGKYINMSTGDVYEGGYRDGMRHGFGRLYYHNGDVFEGSWVNHKREGQGKTVHSDGSVTQGIFRDDHLISS